jgi:hypothetical protein
VRQFRLVLLAAGVAAVLLLAAACGGGKKRVVVTATATQSESTEVTSTDHFTRDNWDLLASNPDAYTGASVDIVGRVFVAPERDEGAIYFQMWADPKNSEWNTVVSYADGSLPIREDSYVHVTGTVQGKFEGQNAFGGDVSAPVIVADTAKVVDATAAASPSRAVLGRAQYAQAGITITVRKVELAADETRFFVSVNNRSSYEFNIYDYSAKVVQGGRQYEHEYSSADYPELSSDLLPGAFTTGVIVFPPLRPNGGIKLYLEGSSENSNVGDYGTLKWTFSWRA